MRYGGRARGRARALVYARPARERDQISRGDTRHRRARAAYVASHDTNKFRSSNSTVGTAHCVCDMHSHTTEICDTLWSLCVANVLSLSTSVLITDTIFYLSYLRTAWYQTESILYLSYPRTHT